MSLAVHVMGSEVRLCHRCCSKVDHLVEVVSTRFFHLKVFPLEVFSDTVSLAVLLLSFIEHFWVFLSHLTSLESDVAEWGGHLERASSPNLLSPTGVSICCSFLLILTTHCAGSRILFCSFVYCPLPSFLLHCSL